MVCVEGLDGAHIAERCISAPFGGLRWLAGIDNVAKLALTNCSGGSREPYVALAASKALLEQGEKGLAKIMAVWYTCIRGGDKVNMSELPKDENGKFILPKQLQIEMMQFFLRTSIPRKKQMREEQLKREREEKNNAPA